MWNLLEQQLESRLLIGTARYPSPKTMSDAIKVSGASIVTVSIRRHATNSTANDSFFEMIKKSGAHVLPNTAGARTARDAVTIAQMARQIFKTNWIKLEVTGDDYTLEPDPIETVKAAAALVEDGFEVFPYSNDSLTLALRLLDAGCRIVMPWASPIGSGKGVRNPGALKILRERLPTAVLIVDAGLGKPSHAAQVMEMGFDAVLLNTAIAQAIDCIAMAKAFRLAVEAGRLAFVSGLIPEQELACPSSPLVGVPFK